MLARRRSILRWLLGLPAALMMRRREEISEPEVAQLVLGSGLVAAGDGVTDDTEAIQRALDLAALTGSPVYLAVANDQHMRPPKN